MTILFMYVYLVINLSLGSLLCLIFKQVNLVHYYIICERAYKYEVCLCMSVCTCLCRIHTALPKFVDNIIKYKIF